MLNSPPDPRPQRRIPKLLLASLLFPLLVLLYVGWIFLNRWEFARAVQEQAAAKKQAAEIQDARRVVQMLGGSEFAIVRFYAAPGEIRKGESAELCYGVSNAASVHLDPPVGDVWPSYSRCISVSPARTTTYKLTATDSSGKTAEATVQIRVK